MRRHIVLVGLPGSGKTTIGQLVAERLGTSFVDPDTLIVRRMQMPVTRIFAEHGEVKFRELEREAMGQALAGPASVIAPGGGWATQPGELEAAAASSLVVYLKCIPTVAAKRAVADGGRPLMAGPDPLEKMRQILKEREPFYLKAHHEVKTDSKAPDQLAAEVVELARRHAGW